MYRHLTIDRSLFSLALNAPTGSSRPFLGPLKRHRRMIFGRNDLKWDGDRLRLQSGRLLATVEPDQKWNGMRPVVLPSGHLSDMVNRTRPRDAAISIALCSLNQPLVIRPRRYRLRLYVAAVRSLLGVLTHIDEWRLRRHLRPRTGIDTRTYARIVIFDNLP
jgi:hypothetical protein